MITQRKMVLVGEKTLVVLKTVQGARDGLIGLDEDDILALIEEGFLLFAWNIGLGEKREVRILPDCIEFYSRTLGSRQYPRTDDQVWGELAQALSGGKPFTTGRRLSLLLNCSSTHVINLIEARLLAVQPGTTWQTGPNGSPVISLASVKTFLTQRRLP